MKTLDQFFISFTGLKPGEHGFDLRVDDSFFDCFEEGEIRHGSIDVTLNLVKEERMLVFQFHFFGTVTLPCDRCGELVDIPINSSETLIVKIGNPGEGRTGANNDDVEWIPETTTRFDTAPFIYETMHLLLPIKRVHPTTKDGKSACNPEILKKLNELCHRQTIDDRWEPLKELTLENKLKK